MNDADVKRFREQLETEAQALDDEDTLGQDGQKTVVLDQTSVGRLSRMDAIQGQALLRH